MAAATTAQLIAVGGVPLMKARDDLAAIAMQASNVHGGTNDLG
jgi:hypothetical protein